MRIKNVLQYLEGTAARLASKTAVTDGQGRQALTFEALLQCARSIGAALLRRDLEGARVAVLMDRSPQAIAAMLGIWYAGGVSVLVDVSQPMPRMQAMLSQASVCAVLFDEPHRASADALSPCALAFDDVSEEVADENMLAAVRRRQIDTDPIYMVFTSGSTGVPKGVLGCHRALIDYAEALLPALGVREDDVLGCQSPLHFDAPFKEILSTMVLGATTVLIPRRCFALPMLLLNFLRENGITAIFWVASALSQISALGALDVSPPTHLRLVAFGSEVFPRVHYDRWRAALPEATFYHLYGPTEATGMSCVWRADRALDAGEKIPIGAPLDNTDAMLIGDHGTRILPCEGRESEVGELYLRGSCLTHGYYAMHEQTAAAFVQNPLQKDYPETAYRTGDMAAYNAQGELIFLGRRDAQIKRMGHRVELGEIEEKVMEYAQITDACCVYLADVQTLVLFYQGQAEEREVMRMLQSTLPRYMLPRHAVRVEAIPRTQNGKRDRMRLLAIAKAQFETENKED